MDTNYQHWDHWDHWIIWTSFGHHLDIIWDLDINRKIWTSTKTRDRPTDGPTDRPSYRDAWTHLKMRHCGTKDLRHDSIACKDRHHHLLLLILSLFKERTADSRHLHYWRTRILHLLHTSLHFTEPRRAERDIHRKWQIGLPEMPNRLARNAKLSLPEAKANSLMTLSIALSSPSSTSSSSSTSKTMSYIETKNNHAEPSTTPDKLHIVTNTDIN